MVKKKVLIIFLLILVIISVFWIFIQNINKNIKTFDVAEYQYYIDNFSSEERLLFSDVETLVQKVEEIWLEEYGECIKKEKPYVVSYDMKNRVWLVQGTLPFNKVGGVANILVENDTGKILAIWHDK